MNKIISTFITFLITQKEPVQSCFLVHIPKVDNVGEAAITPRMLALVDVCTLSVVTRRSFLTRHFSVEDVLLLHMNADNFAFHMHIYAAVQHTGK